MDDDGWEVYFPEGGGVVAAAGCGGDEEGGGSSSHGNASASTTGSDGFLEVAGASANSNLYGDVVACFVDFFTGQGGSVYPQETPFGGVCYLDFVRVRDGCRMRDFFTQLVERPAVVLPCLGVALFQVRVGCVVMHALLCVLSHTHARTRTHTHTHIHTFVHSLIHMYTHKYVCSHIHTRASPPSRGRIVSCFRGACGEGIHAA